MLLLLVACAGAPDDPPVRDTEPDDTAPEQVGDTADAPETAAPEDTADTAEATEDPLVEEIGDQDTDLDGWIFSDDVVHQIEITLDADAVAGLYADPYTSVEGAFTLDGEEMPSVGVRLRGKIGSFRDLSGKPKFAIDFNAFVDDQRFFGLESLSLNNSVVDCSYLKEPLAYRIFRLAGAPAGRTGFGWVRVNGADYGLYILVETPDDRMLTRAWPDPSGNLYDGKYVWYGDWNYTLLDFNIGVDHLFQLEEGVDVGNADIMAVSAAVAANAGGDFKAGMDPVLDWDSWHRALAVEQWVGHNDGYAMNTNNYRVYFDPADGKADYVPWDFDYSFLNDYDWGMSWSSPRGQIAAWCWRDRACARSQGAAVSALVAAVDPVALDAWFSEVASVTYEAAMTDPRQECGAGNVTPWRDYLRSYIAARNDSMRTFWGL